MTSRFLPFGLSLAMCASLAVMAMPQDEPASSPELSPEQQQVKANAESFVAAFNKGDAAAIAAMFTADAEMSVDGEVVATGREGIEDQYQAFFAEQSGLEISVHIDSVRSVGPGLIIEKGVSEVMNDGDDTIVDTYTLVHVQKDGEWLIASADVEQTEVDIPDWKSELGFLVGSWKAEEGDWRTETTFEWVSGGNFLKRTYSVYEGDEVARSGVQVIGWDPLQQSVTSWVFGEEGGHGRGWWMSDGNQWEIQMDGVSATGETYSATNVFTVLDENTIRWQSTNRTVQGYKLDDTDSVRISRVVEVH